MESSALGMIEYAVVCRQADSDGIVHRYCPAHLEDSDLKPNITCAVYNHDGTGITTVMMAFSLVGILWIFRRPPRGTLISAA